VPARGLCLERILLKLVTYTISTPFGTVDRLGALEGEEVVDLTSAYEAKLAVEGEPDPGTLAALLVPPSLLGLLRREERGMSDAREALQFANENKSLRFPLDEVKLRAPLPRPNSVRDFMVVEGHVKGSFGEEIPEEWYEIPVHYKGNPDSILGPDEDVKWPSYTEQLDYELELSAIIGKRGREIPEEDATSYIAGYTVFNDWSARDIQFREMNVKLGPALGKDFANSIGPCLVTPDEIDIYTVSMQARVNGEVWSAGTQGAMRFNFPQIIAHLSGEQTLMPGDLLGSGTVEGGSGLELDRWVQPGDVVELEVEGTGVLRNYVARSQ
jgi:2-keto-4-pentenoate hydratase/2-oxohepta-3-ene-1,7-dioic acid hydratase in catechol pathway